MDIFGLTGEDWQQVRLKLSPTAHHLILEEFPLSRAYTLEEYEKLSEVEQQNIEDSFVKRSRTGFSIME